LQTETKYNMKHCFLFMTQIRYQVHATPVFQTQRDISDSRWNIQEYDEISISYRA